MIYNRLQNNSIRNGSSTIEVIVQSRPILETTYSKIAAEIGQTITLTCRVSGEPKPKIFWKRNEEIINCNEMSDEKCYLRLVKITNKDFGSYRCIAENLLGKEEWTYTIVSRGKEIIQTSSKFRMLSILNLLPESTLWKKSILPHPWK